MSTDIPQKENQLCSNAYLLDERSCLMNSLSVINYNFSSIQTGLSTLDIYGQQWNKIFTVFQANSAAWFNSFTNIKTLSASWNNTYTTINTLSSQWNKEISLYYPYSVEINSWYAMSSAQQISTLNTWLNYIFPPINFPLNQIISVYINLYETTQFSFNFQRSLFDPCTPYGGGAVACGNCGKPYRGCNHHGGLAGYGPCTNAYDGCGSSSYNSGPSSFACPGTGGKKLQIGATQNYSDTHSARINRLRFRNINNVWNNI